MTMISILSIAVWVVFGWSQAHCLTNNRPTNRKAFLKNAAVGASVGIVGATFAPNKASAVAKNDIFKPAPGSLMGQVHVITGASSGLGLESAKRLAAGGATVVLTARTNPKGERAKLEVQEYLRDEGIENDKISFITLDLEHFDSIRSFPQRFKELMGEETRINVLMNNAGLKVEQKVLTEDGFEKTFQSNHLGHFMLTALMFPFLDRQHGARVINLSSIAHKLFSVIANTKERGLDLTNLNCEKTLKAGWPAYGTTKLANIMFTQELQRRADAAGLTWLTTVAVHPGIVGTDIWKDSSVAKTSDVSFQALLSSIFYKSVLTTEQGANSQIMLASNPEIVKGAYYNENGKVEKLEPFARDQVKAKQLWELSENMAGIDFRVA